eukprot:GFYU01007133.1.p1 GENE.GFYU01007133.1~~GFYU01007133.1.p1  ORF type:complete len:225 (-),score=27.39 GFYU01007133.1:215-889(-)
MSPQSLQDSMPVVRQCVMFASFGGYRDLVQWLLTQSQLCQPAGEDVQSPPHSFMRDWFTAACASGNWELCEEIRAYCTVPTLYSPRLETEVSLYCSCLSGNLRLVQWVAGMSGVLNGPECLVWAALGGNTDVCAWLHQEVWIDRHCNAKKIRDATLAASQGGHVGVLRWLHRAYGLTATELEVDGTLRACVIHTYKCNHRETCRWLIKTYDYDVLAVIAGDEIC